MGSRLRHDPSASVDTLGQTKPTQIEAIGLGRSPLDPSSRLGSHGLRGLCKQDTGEGRCHVWAMTHNFNTAYVDDTMEASSEYKVVLTKTKQTLYDIYVIQKHPTYCIIGFYTQTNPSNWVSVTRTVNGTGHTGPSEFCATSI